MSNKMIESEARKYDLNNLSLTSLVHLTNLLNIIFVVINRLLTSLSISESSHSLLSVMSQIFYYINITQFTTS